MEITEQQLAEVMPLNVEMDILTIREALGLINVPVKSVTPKMIQHRENGLIVDIKRPNRVSLWIRVRGPVHPQAKRRAKLPFAIEQVTIGGSKSSHYGSSDDKPTSVSLPAMPSLRSV